VEERGVERLYDGVREFREDVRQPERGQSTTSLEQVERKAAQIVLLGTEDDDELRVLSAIPALPVLRLVGEAEGDRVIERDEVEAPRADRVDDALLDEQSIGVRHEREPRGLRREVRQDVVPPAAHPTLSM